MISLDYILYNGEKIRELRCTPGEGVPSKGLPRRLQITYV